MEPERDLARSVKEVAYYMREHDIRIDPDALKYLREVVQRHTETGDTAWEPRKGPKSALERILGDPLGEES